MGAETLGLALRSASPTMGREGARYVVLDRNHRHHVWDGGPGSECARDHLLAAGTIAKGACMWYEVMLGLGVLGVLMLMTGLYLHIGKD